MERLSPLAGPLLWCALLAAVAVYAGPAEELDRFSRELSAAALERTQHTVRYEGSYRSISYPNGDVPKELGVCTDVVIRAYRALAIDLQRDLHREMKAHFDEFPKSWGASAPDTNIDHRRVPNLSTFFERKGEVLAVSAEGGDYRPGDLVTWTVAGNLPHIGIVVDQRSTDGKRPLVVHNIGRGPKLEDMLFDYPITGHYRYEGQR
jgi:uncharacterized protein YijF (DUF1287 family)